MLILLASHALILQGAHSCAAVSQSIGATASHGAMSVTCVDSCLGAVTHPGLFATAGVARALTDRHCSRAHIII